MKDNSKLVLIGLFCFLLCLVALFFFLFRYETYIDKAGKSWETLSNRYYVAELFLNHRLVKTETVKNLDRNRPLPKGPAIVFLYGERTNLPPDYNQRLLDWVGAGGLLIVKTESGWGEGKEDPLLGKVGLFRHEEEDEDTGLTRSNWTSGLVTEIELDNQIQIGAHDADNLCFYTGSDGQYRIAASYYGEGIICAVADDSFMHNEPMTRNDNAWMLWELATLPDEPVKTAWIVYGSQYASIWRHLFGRGLPLVVSLLLAAIVFCWSIGFREHAVQPDPEPIRRRLSEHIEHIGRFLWTRNRAFVLAEAVRKELFHDLARRHPGLHEATDEEIHRFLAEQSELEEVRVADALRRTSPHNERELLIRIIDLETIRRAL